VRKQLVKEVLGQDSHVALEVVVEHERGRHGGLVLAAAPLRAVLDGHGEGYRGL
jgi:hypothetical protein